jgi:hypothetical protein
VAAHGASPKRTFAIFGWQQPPMERSNPSRPYLLYIALFVAVLAFIMDAHDHHTAKAAGTAGLVLVLIATLIHRTRGGMVYTVLAWVGLLVFIGSLALRLGVHQGWW